MIIWVHGYSNKCVQAINALSTWLMVIQVHVYSAYGLNRYFVYFKAFVYSGTVDTVIDEFHFI